MVGTIVRHIRSVACRASRRLQVSRGLAMTSPETQDAVVRWCGRDFFVVPTRIRSNVSRAPGAAYRSGLARLSWSMPGPDDRTAPVIQDSPLCALRSLPGRRRPQDNFTERSNPARNGDIVACVD